MVTIGIAFALLLICLFSVFDFSKEEPEYFILEIPNPQRTSNSPYSSEYADREEFSSFIWHDSEHKYLIWRMYTDIYLDGKEFQTREDIEKYYDERIKELGWTERQQNDCAADMTEFHPEKPYKAYLYPREHHRDPTACLAIWSESEEGNRISILIKTMNPNPSQGSIFGDWDWVN